MNDINNTLKIMVRSWLLNKNIIENHNSDKLLKEFLRTKPYNIMQNELTILFILPSIMKIEIYKILLENNNN